MSKKFFFHCSGALTSDELNLLSWQGAHVASLHPIQTFTDKNNSWRGLEKCYFGFEGAIESKEIADKLVDLFNGSILIIKKENKKLYHSAACFISNYLVTLAYISEELFKKSGIDGNLGLQAFKPLIYQTIENIYNNGVVETLTGPVSRGDINVIAEHVNSLIKKKPEYVSTYASLGMITAEIALKRKSIDKYKLDSMNKIFQEYSIDKP